MESNVDAYIDALVKEVNMASVLTTESVRVHTVYIGGGTPSILNVGHYEKIFEAICKHYTLTESIEITTEANPSGLTYAYLKDLHQLGIERLSMGMQSGNRQELKLLGRKHQLEDVYQSVELARQAEFKNINLDLIFGIPRQTLASFQKSLAIALEMQPEHLSIYSLTVEEGTPLARMIAAGQVPEVDDDLAAEMYAWVMAELAHNGFDQYEISNWAKNNNLRSRHNLQYWYNRDYLGFGAGAHSHYEARRWANVNPIMRYIQQLEESTEWNAAQPPAAEEVLELTERDDIQETMMMGLRLTEEGVAEEDFQLRFGKKLEEIYPREIPELIQNGLLEKVLYQDKHILRLTTKGRMLGNQVFMQFIDA